MAAFSQPTTRHTYTLQPKTKLKQENRTTESWVPLPFSRSGGPGSVSSKELFIKARQAVTAERGESRESAAGSGWQRGRSDLPLRKASGFAELLQSSTPGRSPLQKSSPSRGLSSPELALSASRTAQLRDPACGAPAAPGTSPLRAAVRPRPQAQSAAAPAGDAKYSHEEKGAVDGEERVGKDQHEVDYLCKLYCS